MAIQPPQRGELEEGEWRLLSGGKKEPMGLGGKNHTAGDKRSHGERKMAGCTLEVGGRL